MTDGKANDSGEPGRSRPFVPEGRVRRIYFRIKRWWRSCRAYLTDPRYRALMHSGLFDTRYYLGNDPALDPRYIDPLIHYLEAGRLEGRKPNSLFDSGYYREMHPECGDGDPLLHYITKGWREGADPTPLFFTAWYAATYPESVRGGKAPLRHYLRSGWREGRKPNPYTDFSGYLTAHPDLAARGSNPLAHFVDGGYRDDPGPLPFFDEAYYLEDNPSAAGLAMTPMAHYLQYGSREGRSPNRFFDPRYYLASHPDAGPSELTAFLHCNSAGRRLGYRPAPLFDPAYYAGRYPEYAGTHSHPLLHYQQIGIARGYHPCAEVADLPEKPVISVITPVYNTDELLLRRCIHSVLHQAYPHWELCLADDGSDRPHVRRLLAEYAARDQRVKVRHLERNTGIAAASNEAAALAAGAYLGFLDHDDELTLDALYEVAREVNDGAPDIVYTDEELVNLESRRLDGFFKPDYNPELLLTHNYITHFLAARRELFVQAGGFSAEYEGAQDFDLALRLTELAAGIAHIPRALYRWRASATSTSINHEQKTYADASGRRALEAAMRRRRIEAKVEPGEWKYYYRVRRHLRGNPPVTLVVLPDGNGEGPAQWHERMEPFLRYRPLDILLISFGVPDREGLPGIRLQGAAVAESPAAVCNRAARESEGRHLLFVAREFVPADDGWIGALLEHSQEEAAGAVTGRIENEPVPEEQAWTAGAMSWDRFRSFFLHASREINNVYCEQNVLAAPIDLCLVKRALFEQAGGFDESLFPWCYFDIDFCLRLHTMGRRNVYTPLCRGVRRNPGLVRAMEGAGERELAVFRAKWRELLRRGDPYCNPGRVLAESGMSRAQWLAWYAGNGPVGGERAC